MLGSHIRQELLGWKSAHIEASIGVNRAVLVILSDLRSKRSSELQILALLALFISFSPGHVYEIHHICQRRLISDGYIIGDD